MDSVVSIALSGLRAQDQRLSASASNIANATTTGALPTLQAPATTVYKPLSVNMTTMGGGEVFTTVTADENGYSPVYAGQNSPYANSEGMVAAPNVDLAQEAINVMEAKLLFKANVNVLKTHNEMVGDLLDIVG